MTRLELAAQRILELPSDNLRARFTRALQVSLTLDTERIPPQPASPAWLHERFGLDLLVQANYSISLPTQEAIAFLADIGFEIRYDAFRRKYGAKEFQAKFNRALAQLDGRTHLFTYAEVMHLTDYAFPPDLPESLAPYRHE